MSNLRFLGLIIGILVFLLAFKKYRGPRWNRFNFILFTLFSISLIVVSLNPDVVNIIAGMLALKIEHRGRILALLIFSNIFLWLFSLYFKSKFDDYRNQFDILVKRLGYEKSETKMHDIIASKDIIVVMPAFNEEENLKELFKKIPAKIENKNVGVIVVDDGSTDDTFRVTEDAGYIAVRNIVHRGGGAALRLGYEILRENKARIIITMDADGQHNPEEMSVLIKPILEGKYDLVVGSRLLGKTEACSRLRLTGLFIFNFLISFLLGTKVTDCSSGFRAFKKELLDNVNLEEDQFHTSELIIDAVKKNFKVTEVPITIYRRKYGKSKKGAEWSYGINFAKAIFKTWWRKR